MLRYVSLLLLPAVLLLVNPIPAMDTPPEARKQLQHPRMHEALYELREARKALSGLEGDVGGRKTKSLAAIDDAVRSVRLILAVRVDDPSPIRRDKDFYKKWKDHPRIRAALADLRAARHELENARSDFQGNKKRALKDIDRAVDQLHDLLEALAER